MDGRRHSVDVPISRTLVALRRVRSLRDPSTNSMSKLSALIDNLNWETNSHNGITLGFENGSCGGNGDNDALVGRSQTKVMEGERCESDRELYYSAKRCNSKQVSPLALRGEFGNIELAPDWSFDVKGIDAQPHDLEMVCDNGILCDNGLSSGDSAERGGSSNEPDEVSTPAERRHSGRPKCSGNRAALSRVTAGDVSSCGDSPYLSIDKTPKHGLSQEISLYRNSDAGMMDFCHQGCGVSSCWSRTMKFRGPDLLPDEERPLVLGNGDPMAVARRSVDWKIDSEGVESPRSFCQKFMPKLFTDLVGQEMVAASLMNAINKQQIASLYLFHGPRGTGKTSASRIFAAALNCLSHENGRPCGVCQECVIYFAGRSRDVREVDSVRINKKERRRLLFKNARFPPVFSKFKVYIVDECHLMHRETWTTLLSSLEELPERVVFVMTAPNLEKLPSSAVSKSQRFHFQKVKAVDITTMLERICMQEGLDYDLDALNFIAAKSNGSLRDAEMMLDQLGLVGKKITIPLVYEVNGFVSNDELLDLLHLALSSDASNTVKRARELLASVDPLQLTSQLANLIMDILAGKCPEGVSEVRRKLFGTNNSEADLQQLSYALKILLQTEKHLRTSKNQATWLTAALLQLSSTVASYDASEVRLSVRTIDPQDGDFLSTTSTGESLRHCEDAELGKMGMQDEKEELHLVWMRATGICTSNSFRRFLQKHGKLLSVCLNQGVAVAELEFDRPEYVSKAEKSWKTIAGALQHVLGYNVELRIYFAPNNASSKDKELKKAPYLIRLFNCSRRVNLTRHLSTECGSNVSGSADVGPTSRDRYVETCPSECPSSQISHTCCHGKDLLKTIRSNNGNALSISTTTPNGFLPDTTDRDHRFNEQINRGDPSSNTCNPVGNPGSANKSSKLRCWRNAMFPFRKAWKLRNEQRNEQLMDYALHCSSAN